MRRALIVLVLALVAVASGIPARAEDAPRPWFLRLMTPTEASAALQEQLRGLSRNQQWNARPELAGAYLDAWTASGRAVTAPAEVLALHRLNASARRFDQAVQVAMPLLADADAAVADRAQAAQGIAGFMAQAEVREALGEEALAGLASSIEAFATSDEAATGRVDPSRLLFDLAQYYGVIDQPERVVALNMAAARASPGRAAQAGRSILRTWMSSTAQLEDYPALLEKATKHFDELRALAASYVETVAASGDEQAKARAESTLKLLENGEAPLSMLGQPAPAWTLEHAFGDVEQLADLEGKVVFVDFWATWCGWCIRSFPAVRDLLRDYADEDLAIIGVTTTAPSVVEANYQLDDDMKHKLEAGQTIPKIRLASARAPADPANGIYPADVFPAKEREALTRFIANHEMTWPVLMIDKAEPKAKFGLQGWPHAVVLDRQGRIRYFKVGALLRDREEQVKHFREILDALLAEDAGTSR